MEQPVTPFDIVLMEQRNLAMNEVAFWRARTTELEAKVKELQTPEVESEQS